MLTLIITLSLVAALSLAGLGLYGLASAIAWIDAELEASNPKRKR